MIFHAKISDKRSANAFSNGPAFFQTFRKQLARSFYSNMFDVRQEKLNLHLSLLAHQQVGPNSIADLQAVTNVRDTLDKLSAASPETMHTL